MSQGNPFSSIVVDRGAAVAEQVAALLQGRALIDPHDNAVHVTATNTSVKQRILLALAARKALAMYPRDEAVHPPAPPEAATPREIEQMTGLGGGTVRPAVKALLGNRVLQKDGDRYSLIVPALARIIQIVETGDEG